MPRCKNKVSIWVARGFGYKEVKMPCGSTSIDGGTNMCESCEEEAMNAYPHGWMHVPGDVCKHGNYVGDCGGPDYICGLCEDGE